MLSKRLASMLTNFLSDSWTFSAGSEGTYGPWIAAIPGLEPQTCRHQVDRFGKFKPFASCGE
jgi:hypothetical protein